MSDIIKHLFKIRIIVLFWVLPSCRFASWHLSLDRLKPWEHMALKSLKRAIEHRGTYFVEASWYLKLYMKIYQKIKCHVKFDAYCALFVFQNYSYQSNLTDFIERHVVHNFDKYLCRQLNNQNGPIELTVVAIWPNTSTTSRYCFSVSYGMMWNLWRNCHVAATSMWRIYHWMYRI